MPYASRDAQGRIASLHRTPAGEAQEFVDLSSPEVLAFLGQPPAETGFDALDSGFVRVLEDLVWLLVDKNLLRIGELPMPAQAKLLARNEHRLLRATGGARPPSPSTWDMGGIIDDSAFAALPPSTRPADLDGAS